MGDELELQFKEDLEIVGMLSYKMVVFIAEVAGGAKIADAAERAGYARSAGYRLMKMPEVLEAITQRKVQKLRELEISEDRVMRELAKLIFFNPQDLFHSDGKPKDIQELAPEVAAVITGIDVVDMYEGRGESREKVGELKKIKLADKLKAIELAGRYLKLWTDKIEVSGPEALAERLRAARMNVGKEVTIDATELPPARD